MSLVEARRGRMGSSTSVESTEEVEKEREGAVDRGDEAAAGSSGMQCEVVRVRRASGRDMMDCWR